MNVAVEKKYDFALQASGRTICEQALHFLNVGSKNIGFVSF
jgi:hypothetical protein